MRATRGELERAAGVKKRAENYRNAHAKTHYYRAVCLFPTARRGELDRAIRESGAGSVSGYLLGLIEEDLRRRGISASDQDGAAG